MDLQNSALFKLVFENALNGILLIDEKLKCLDANSAVSQMFGRSRFDIIGRSLRLLLSDTEKPLMDIAARQLWEKGSWEGTLLGGSGTDVRTYDWKISSQENSGVALAIITDITARVRYEAMLRTTAEVAQAKAGTPWKAERGTVLFEFIAAHRDEVLTNILSELQYRYPNRGSRELLDGLSDFLEEVIHALRRDALDSGAEGGSFWGTSAKNHGQKRNYQGFDISRVVYDYGLICETVSGAAIEHGYEPTPREFQILNRCIDEAIAMAVESYDEIQHSEDDKERAEQLGSVAHEIRSAVGSASLAFEMIRQGKAASDGRTAEIVLRAHSRIAALTAEALADARSRTGTTAQRSEIRLLAFLAEIISEVPSERGITVQTEIPAELTIDADERLLASAVTNLVQNAFKFTRKGGTITVRAALTDGAVSVEVEDQCGGLPGGVEKDLFKPFVQRSKDRRGAGLGLAIARRAVEAHGGTLGVRNVAGIGCVFQILIPRTTRILDPQGTGDTEKSA